MAGDIQEQLAFLRSRIAKIDRKFASPRPKPASPVDTRDKECLVEECLSGSEVETPLGRHWETEKLFERNRRHGSFDISNLAELPSDLFAPISKGQITDAPAGTWAFLDTETTGLAGGAGTYAFLVGVGRITPEGFRVRQFFMRDYGEEASLLDALSKHLAPFRVLVTYNGKAYDQPLLETRFQMARARAPFDAMEHLDLLYGARRLWKLRLESCRLVELENQILGMERQGDVPGAMIPSLYFEYLRRGESSQLVPVFYHNATDILTLACLCGIVPRAFEAPYKAQLKHGAEMVGLGRWWRQMNEPEHALALFRQAVEKGLPDDLLFRTLWDIAMLEKRLGRNDATLAAFTDLASSPNPFRLAALEELAKYYEHRERNHALAFEMTLAALELSTTPALERRKSRLEQRLSSRRNGRLL